MGLENDKKKARIRRHCESKSQRESTTGKTSEHKNANIKAETKIFEKSVRL